MVSREEREDQIFEYVANKHPEMVTLRQIAGQLNLAKSVYVSNIVKEMVEQELLIMSWAEMPNGLGVKIFGLHPDMQPDDNMAFQFRIVPLDENYPGCPDIDGLPF
jgi:hypothetical protein